MSEGIITTISPNGTMANESIVQVTPVGQYVVTIPRALAQAMGLKKGDKVEFILEDGKATILKKVPQEADPKTK
jgi:AbrB family looped-hinge helix DNA binding protein